MPKFQLRGFSPDLDPGTEGIITECENIVPTLRGFAGAPSTQAVGISAMPAAAISAAVLRKNDDTTRFFAATTADIFEQSGTGWTSRGGSTYVAASAEEPWRFAAFGNYAFAAQRSNALQVVTSAGAFSSVSAGPQAALIETVNQFMLLANTQTSQDQWQCCALGNPLSWTANPTTQATSGQITSIPGEIVGLKRLGDNAVIYKERGLFLGRYVGPPNIWSWDEIPGRDGAISQECIVDLNYAHAFVGLDNFWVFDGSRPIPIGNPIREYFFGRLVNGYRYLTKALHDKNNSLIYWFYVASGTTINACVVYNYKTDQWGKADQAIEVPVIYAAAGTTYDGLTSLFTTYDAGIPYSYDSSYWQGGTEQPAVFDTSHIVRAFTGQSTGGTMTLFEMGDEEVFTTLKRTIPMWTAAPTTADQTNYYKNEIDDAFSTGNTVTINHSRFDVLQSARWHKLLYSMTGPFEIKGLVVDVEQDGTE